MHAQHSSMAAFALTRRRNVNCARTAPKRASASGAATETAATTQTSSGGAARGAETEEARIFSSLCRLGRRRTEMNCNKRWHFRCSEMSLLVAAGKSFVRPLDQPLGQSQRDIIGRPWNFERLDLQVVFLWQSSEKISRNVSANLWFKGCSDRKCYKIESYRHP